MFVHHEKTDHCGSKKRLKVRTEFKELRCKEFRNNIISNTYVDGRAFDSASFDIVSVKLSIPT